MPPKELTAEDKAELANLALALAHSPDRAVVAELVRKYGAKDPRIAPFVNSFADVVPGQQPNPQPDPKKKIVTEGELDERFAAEEGKRRLAAEKRNGELVRELIVSGRVTGVQDLSDGGLGVALGVSCGRTGRSSGAIGSVALAGVDLPPGWAGTTLPGRSD